MPGRSSRKLVNKKKPIYRKKFDKERLRRKRSDRNHCKNKGKLRSKKPFIA
jgi:hypothetical protein